jgi:N utilization substance protein B
VDRNVLRLAIREMLGDNGAPVRAVINEAVELAKSFGSDNSAKFVNGVLGAIERQRTALQAELANGRG